MAKKSLEIMVPLKHQSNFWGTLEMPFINCEINLDLNWSENCVIVATYVAGQATTLSITDQKLVTFVIRCNFIDSR